MGYKEYCEQEVLSHFNHLARNYCPKGCKCEEEPIGYPRPCVLCWVEYLFNVEVVENDGMESN